MELNPFSYEFHADPYPVYRWLRDEHPCYRHEALDCWVLSRYADVLEAHRDWETFSSCEGPMIEPVPADFFETHPLLIAMDPPRHTRMRKLVSRVFTPNRVAELEPQVRAFAAGHLEPLREAGGGDFVQDFSALLPMDVIFTLLGVPAVDRQMLRGHVDTMLDRDPDTPAIPVRAVEASIALHAYFDAFVDEVRAHPERHPGLIADLVEVELDDEEGNRTRLTDAEVTGFCGLLGAAGSETVARLLANAAILFLRFPDVHRAVLDDPSRLADAVEEVLRFWPPSQIQARTATREVQRHGVTIPAGGRVLLLTGAATHDEREYPEPDDLRLDRPPHLALGFGHGIHVCLGASLARLESRVALEEFTTGFPRYEIDEAACERVHMTNVHGFARVPFTTA
ncbi:MAG: cytochrome P450 [Acidimicrobiales bacterium]